MTKWLLLVAKRLTPLMNALEARQMSSSYTQADETHIQVLKEPGRKAEQRSFMWTLLSHLPNGAFIVRYHYSMDRSSQTACQLLSSLHGFIQTDGYAGYYEVFKKNPELIHGGCAMHARRKFKEAQRAANGESLADWALEKFATLYQIEEKCKTLSVTDRFHVRLKEAYPIWEEMLAWVEKYLPKARPKDPLTQAMAYFQKHYTHLTAYLKNGFYEMDNGRIEREIRYLSIGRKNWLFCNSVAGAKASAAFYSLISTIRINKLNLQETLSKLIDDVAKATTKADYERILDYLLATPSPQKS